MSASLIAITLQQVTVGVDAPVAQEWPDAAHRVGACTIDPGDQQFRFIDSGTRDELALWAGDETRPPELRAATDAIGIGLEADPVARQDGQAVSDGVAALDGDPGIAL